MASFTNIKTLNSSGLQKLCVDSSGSDKENVYVCDAEGILMKFNEQSLLSDGKPTVIEVGDTTSASMAWSGDNILIGYSKVDFVAGEEKQVVGRVIKQNFELSDISDLLEFQLGVTTVDANSENVVGGSSDYGVKCISLKDPDAELKQRTLEAEPLSVRLDPRHQYVAISTANGNVSILNLDTFSVAQTLTNIFPKFESKDISKPLVHMNWSKDGSLLFVPSKDCIKSFRRDGWAEAESYAIKDAPTESFSVTAVSQCGTYLAASTMDKQVAVWNIDKKEMVSCEQYTRISSGSTVITSIEFSPFSKQLIIADSNKGICMFNFIPSEPSSSAAKDLLDGMAAVDSDDEADSLILNRTSNKKDDLFNDNPMEEDEDTRMSTDIAAIKKQFGYGDTDIGGLEEFGFKVGDPVDELRPFTPEAAAPQVVYTEPPPPKKVLIPERFVCSSSPVDPENTQRYLKYNRFGVVKTYVNEAAKVSNVDVEFHDKTVHRDINIDNFEFNYELADISLAAVALASLECKKKEKELDKAMDEMEDLETDSDANKQIKKGTSVLHVIPINSFGKQPWSMTMPRGDGVIDVLVSKTQIVVLTKQRHLRVFTVGGIQRQIFTHPAPVLTAACFEDKIAIASVSGSEFYENKKTAQWRFEITEYSLNQRSWYKDTKTRTSAGAVSRMDVPVETGEQLDWMGYSSQGKLAVMDSAYNVNFLSAPGLWVPVFQGSSILRAPSDGIFPVGMTAKEFRYIYCRGSRTPLVAGINVPTTVSWKFPFCQPDNARTEMEHSLFLNELALAEAVLDKDGDRTSEETKKLTTTIIKLFAFLAKTNSDGPAAEVAALVNSGPTATAKTIQSLCNYASKCKKLALADKVAEIGRKMTDREDERSNDNDEIRPARRVAVVPRKKAVTTLVQSKPDSDDEEEADRTQLNLDMDSSISTQPIPIAEKKAANPFAKVGPSGDSNSSTQASLSIFDQLEVPVDRKRPREEESAPASSGSTRKQAKLHFGTTEKKEQKLQKVTTLMEKENVNSGSKKDEEVQAPIKKTPSPYELWLAETKSSLQFEFDGDEADFSKYCIQSFRGLSKEEKNVWKSRAKEAEN